MLNSQGSGLDVPDADLETDSTHSTFKTQNGREAAYECAQSEFLPSQNTAEGSQHSHVPRVRRPRAEVGTRERHLAMRSVRSMDSRSPLLE